MRSRPGIFWKSLFLTLLLMLPLIGAVAFFASQRQQQESLRQVAAARGGISVEQGAQNTHRLLLVVQQETPAFVLLRIDAPTQHMEFCALPSELWVDAPAGQTTLADCAMAAGPGRAAQLLTATLTDGDAALPELEYLAATPACWSECFGNAVTARLDPAALGLKAAGESTVELRADGVNAFLAAAQDGLTGDAAAALRTAVWEAFARQNPDAVQAMPQALREQSARTLTSLMAQDLTALEQTMTYLQKQTALTVDYTVPETEAAEQGFHLTETGREQVLGLLQ